MSIVRFAPVVVLVIAAVTSQAFAQFGSGGPEIDVKTLLESSSFNAGSKARGAVSVALEHGWHVNSNTPNEDYLIPTELSLKPDPGISVVGVGYPEAKEFTFSFSTEPMAVYEEQFEIVFALAVDDDLATGRYGIEGALRYQACNDKQSWAKKTVDEAFEIEVIDKNGTVVPANEELFDSLAPRFKALSVSAPQGDSSAESPMPEAAIASSDWREQMESFEAVASASGYMKPEPFIEFLQRAESGETSGEAEPFEGKSLWTILALVLIGGLALNLTPCVLPLIPINIAIIGAGANAGSRARGFVLGGAYGAGIALTYGVLGLVVVLTSGAFGAINASPWFNAIIALVFIVLGVAMFDLVSVDFSRLQAKVGLRSNTGGRFAIAFAMGCVAALLAGACVAPVVIAVILFARGLYTDGSTFGLALPFVLGVGMAIPWPFAGAGLSFLPKPGKWMVRIKYAFGVFILAMAAYYGQLAYTLFDERYLVNEAEVAASVAALDESGWHTDLSAALTEAQNAEQPVFVDFWATWCKSCLTMNSTTFKDERVEAALGDYVKVKVQTEDFSAPETRAILERFEVVGLPTYVVLHPTAL